MCVFVTAKVPILCIVYIHLGQTFTNTLINTGKKPIFLGNKTFHDEETFLSHSVCCCCFFSSFVIALLCKPHQYDDNGKPCIAIHLHGNFLTFLGFKFLFCRVWNCDAGSYCNHCNSIN